MRGPIAWKRSPSSPTLFREDGEKGENSRVFVAYYSKPYALFVDRFIRLPQRSPLKNMGRPKRQRSHRRTHREHPALKATTERAACSRIRVAK